MTIVRFERHCPPYNSGETAGFDAETASALIASGAAVEVTEGESSPEVVPAAPAARRRRPAAGKAA
jgi:hypothetical protein